MFDPAHQRSKQKKIIYQHIKHELRILKIGSLCFIIEINLESLDIFKHTIFWPLIRLLSNVIRKNIFFFKPSWSHIAYNIRAIPVIWSRNGPYMLAMSKIVMGPSDYDFRTNFAKTNFRWLQAYLLKWPYLNGLQAYMICFWFEIASIFSPLCNWDYIHFRSPLQSWLQSYLVTFLTMIASILGPPVYILWTTRIHVLSPAATCQQAVRVAWVHVAWVRVVWYNL